MKIGFVAEPYEEQNASGMGYVVLELMRNFPTEGKEHEFIFYSSKPIDGKFVPGTYENIILPLGFLNKLWFFFTLREKPDALIFMVPMMPIIASGMKVIPMCQELASQKIKPQGLREKLFAFFRDQILMRISLARAEHVIAASQATKDDLKRFYGLREEKISVVYDGFQDLETHRSSAPVLDESLKPYFFFVGKVKYRKNVHGIVSAFIAFKERTGAGGKLVIAGDYGGSYYGEIAKQISDHGITEDVRFVGYAVGPTLYAYYKNALACVFPSINEGFGMPIVEAMSLGTPVITSNISSMAEVAGDAGLLVDPHDISDISNAMERIYSDAQLREDLIEKGKRRADDFSWPKAAREYIKIAEGV